MRNLGNIEREKLFKYLDMTKYSFSSNENYYSLFLIDSIASGVKVFVNKNFKKKLIRYFNKNNFIFYKDISNIKYLNISNKVLNKEKKISRLKNNMNSFLRTI